MNVLAIDHGSRRVGLAVGSTEVGVAVPLRVLELRDEATLIADLRRAIKDEAIGRVVVGLPSSTDGSSSVQTDAARAFAGRLEAEIDVPVVLEDERFSSREIVAHMEAMGGRKAWKASGLERDAAAAALFLQTHLDRLKLQG